MLYLSPYFPPEARVGALRPLKFVRHLPEFGWYPEVVTRAPQGLLEPDLLAWLPPDLRVHRPTERRPRPVRGSAPGAKPPRLRWPDWLARPDVIPLGAHVFDLPRTLLVGSRLLRERAFDAMVVNADPFAAAVAGALLSRRHGVPLVLDFRDPWALCELRQPLRFRSSDRALHRLERFVVETAGHVILNTNATRDAYREHYRDLPSDRFSALHNHFDPTLDAGSSAADPIPDRAARARFSLLFFGNLRPYLGGENVLELLVSLRARGITPGELELKVMGSLLPSLVERASTQGVAEYLRAARPVPYPAARAALASADMLLVISHAGRQRIPAKFFDYLSVDRPILAITSNPELETLVQNTGAGLTARPDEVSKMTQFVVDTMREPRRAWPRRGAERFESRRATGRLAEILDRVSEARS